MNPLEYNSNIINAFTEMTFAYKEGGIDALLEKTKNQKQNDRYHSFDVGTHRLKVEEAIQAIIQHDKDAILLANYGLLHDIAKGFTTSYKEDGSPQELGHEIAGYEFLKTYTETNEFMLFCVKNHHKLSDVKINQPLIGTADFGFMTEESDITALTNLLLIRIKEAPLLQMKEVFKLIDTASKQFNTKSNVLLALKLLGYALLADALGGFKKEIAFPQFFKAQQLIRIDEIISSSDYFLFKEDEELFRQKVINVIRKTTELNTPPHWVYDLELIKEDAVSYFNENPIKLGSEANNLGIAILKRIAYISQN